MFKQSCMSIKCSALAFLLPFSIVFVHLFWVVLVCTICIQSFRPVKIIRMVFLKIVVLSFMSSFCHYIVSPIRNNLLHLISTICPKRIGDSPRLVFEMKRLIIIRSKYFMSLPHSLNAVTSQ